MYEIACSSLYCTVALLLLGIVQVSTLFQMHVDCSNRSVVAVHWPGTCRTWCREMSRVGLKNIYLFIDPSNHIKQCTYLNVGMSTNTTCSMTTRASV